MDTDGLHAYDDNGAGWLTISNYTGSQGATLQAEDVRHFNISTRPRGSAPTAWQPEVFGTRGSPLTLRGGPAGPYGISIEPGPLGLSVPGLPTTSVGANLNLGGAIGGSTLVHVSTSSRRYKLDEQPAAVDTDAVLAMEPKTWRDRAEVAADPDTERRYVGLIAEDLAELGLGEFLTYDAEGQPNAIQYDRLSVALLAVAQRQQAQLEAVEGRLAAVESGRVR